MLLLPYSCELPPPPEDGREGEDVGVGVFSGGVGVFSGAVGSGSCSWVGGLCSSSAGRNVLAAVDSVLVADYVLRHLPPLEDRHLHQQ
jgi:hypothetical protein